MEKISKDIIIRQANAVTDGKYNLSVLEHRLFYHVLIALKNQNYADENLKLFDEDIWVTIPYAQLRKFDDDNNLSENYKKACRTLRAKTLQVTHQAGTDSWHSIGYIKEAEYKAGEYLKVQLSKFILPQILNLTRCYTVMSANSVMQFRSKYTQRFYQWCSKVGNKPIGNKVNGEFSFTPSQINKLLQTDFKTFKIHEKVIKVAQTEMEQLFLENKCEYMFQTTVEQLDRKIHKWKFVVYKRDKNIDLLKIQDNQSQLIGRSLILVKQYLKLNLVKELFEKLERQNRLLEFCARMDTLKIQIDGGFINSAGGYIRTMVVNEYGISLSADSKPSGDKPAGKIKKTTGDVAPPIIQQSMTKHKLSKHSLEQMGLSVNDDKATKSIEDIVREIRKDQNNPPEKI